MSYPPWGRIPYSPYSLIGPDPHTNSESSLLNPVQQHASSAATSAGAVGVSGGGSAVAPQPGVYFSPVLQPHSRNGVVADGEERRKHREGSGRRRRSRHHRHRRRRHGHGSRRRHRRRRRYSDSESSSGSSESSSESEVQRRKETKSETSTSVKSAGSSTHADANSKAKKSRKSKKKSKRSTKPKKRKAKPVSTSGKARPSPVDTAQPPAATTTTTAAHTTNNNNNTAAAEPLPNHGAKVSRAQTAANPPNLHKRRSSDSLLSGLTTPQQTPPVAMRVQSTPFQEIVNSAFGRSPPQSPLIEEADEAGVAGADDGDNALKTTPLYRLAVSRPPITPTSPRSPAELTPRRRHKSKNRDGTARVLSSGSARPSDSEEESVTGAGYVARKRSITHHRITSISSDEDEAGQDVESRLVKAASAHLEAASKSPASSDAAASVRTKSSPVPHKQPRMGRKKSKPKTKGKLNARRMWARSVQSIKFLRRLGNLSTLASDDVGLGQFEGELPSDEQFERLIKSLSRNDMMSSLKYMFRSLRQFRRALEETKVIARNIEKQASFDRIVERVQAVVEAENVTLFQYDQRQALLFAVATCYSDSFHEGPSSLQMTLGLGEGFVGWVARTCETINVPSRAYDESMYSDEFDTAAKTLTSSVLCVPVFDNNQDLIAVLQAVNKAGGKGFTEQDNSMVEFMCLVAGSMMHNTLLYDEAIHRRMQTETLLQITELMSSEIATEKIIHRVVEATYMLVNAVRITFYNVQAENDALVARIGDTEEEVRLSISGGKGFPQYVALTNRTLVVSNPRRDWRFDPTYNSRYGFEIESVLCVPVRDHKNKTVAVIEAINKKDGTPYTLDDQQLLESMAVSAGIILRRAQLYEEAVARRRQSEALLHLTEILSAEDGTDKLIQKLTMAAYTLVPCESVVVYTVDQRSHVMQTQHSLGNRNTIPVGQGVVGTVALTGKEINVHVKSPDWRFDIAEEYAEAQFPVHSVLAVPIKEDLGQIVAVLEAVNCKSDEDAGPVPFSSSDAEALKSLAVTGGTVLRKSQLYDENARRRTQTEALLQITELMSAEMIPEQIMRRIIEASYTLIHAERISLFKVDKAHKNIQCVVSRDEEMQGKFLPYGSGIVSHVAMTGRTLMIDDPYDDPRFDPEQDRKTGFVTTSLLTVPVTNRQNEVVAIIQAVNKMEGHSFTREDVSIMESMAVSAGIILHKAQLYEEALRESRKSTALMQLVQAAQPNSPVETVVERIVQVAYSAIGADRVTLYFVDQVERKMWCLVTKDHEVSNIPLGKGIAGSVASTGEVVNVADAYDDPRFDSTFDTMTGYRTRSVLCLPISDKSGQPIAVLQALNKIDENTREAVAFTHEDMQLMEAFTAELSSVLRRNLTDALLEHSHADEQLGALMDMYRHSSGRVGLKSIARDAQRFEWPQAGTSVSLTELRTLEFDVFRFVDGPDEVNQGTELLLYCFDIFREMQLIDRFSIPEDKLRNFFEAARRGYRGNPFHNWLHGFSVLHMTYYQLRNTKAHTYLNELDVLGLLIGALCHDIDHPGNTNTFEVNSETQLAVIHNGRSVLENHHAYKTLQILKDPECNILCNLEREEVMAIRVIIVDAIMSTDMTMHFESCKRLDNRIEPFFDASVANDRQEVVNKIIHSADLSGQVLPIHIARVWEERITREFRAQAEAEHRLGLETLPFMKNLDNLEKRYHAQVNFIQYVLVPWWRSVVRILPELQPCFDNLLENRTYYEQMARGEIGGAAVAAATAEEPADGAAPS